MGGFRDGVEVFIYIYIACLRQEVASLPRLLSAYGAVEGGGMSGGGGGKGRFMKLMK
jgi:hypothetical protein